MFQEKKVLIIAAHPDDEVLGCGGTIARLAIEGKDVYTLILGEGITSRDAVRNRAKRGKALKELKRHISNANKILGVKKPFVFDFPDNRFDTVALLDVIKIIEKVKKQVNPDVVFTHHHGDLNIDHQITSTAVITAFRPVTGERVKALYSFEIPSSTEWNSALPSNHFMPNFFMDISKTLELKMRAMREYSSEIRNFPHPRSTEAIEIIAQQRGIQVGLAAAEAFEVVRLIRD